MLDNPQQLFQQISQGVYVISVQHEQQHNAFTAAWVMQVSFAPPLICFSINPEHRSYDILKAGEKCCISVLSKQQSVIAEHFGQSGIADKMSGYTWKTTETGTLALADSLAYFDCQVSHYNQAGDHQLVICNVIGGDILHTGSPLLYIDTQNMDNSQELYKK